MIIIIILINVIHKNKLDFDPSVNLGPIFVDNNKIESRCSSWDQTRNASISHTNKFLAHHYLIFFFVLLANFNVA